VVLRFKVIATRYRTMLAPHDEQATPTLLRKLRKRPGATRLAGLLVFVGVGEGRISAFA
jgi:hypothetical protein